MGRSALLIESHHSSGAIIGLSSMNLIPQLGQYFGSFSPKYNLPRCPLHKGQRHTFIFTYAADMKTTTSRIIASAFDAMPWYRRIMAASTITPTITANRFIFARRIANSAATFFVNVFVELSNHLNASPNRKHDDRNELYVGT